MNTILFVCTGNTCRSSMAEGLFKKLISEDMELKDIKVVSAGTGVFYSGGATEQAIEAVREMGVDIRGHKAKQITNELINEADLILTMTMAHKLRILNINPEAKNKVFTLKEFVNDDLVDDLDISDPFGCPLEEYKKCAQEIYEYLVKVKEKIKNMKNMKG